jgi:TrmH family RNA methyltransferase
MFLHSKENRRIKLCKQLMSDGKHRAKHGLFVLEGLRSVNAAALSDAEITAVFVTRGFRSAHPEAVPDSADVFLITDELSAYLSDTETPQGLFALCKIPAAGGFTVTGDGRYILLHNLQDPGNLGTIIRSADAFGIDALFTVNCCDLFSPKVIRATAGGIFRVNIRSLDLESAFALFRSNGIKTIASVTDHGARPVGGRGFNGTAVFIGNEGNGLPPGVVSACDETLTIRLRGGADSLNAAVAAGIIMYEMSK